MTLTRRQEKYLFGVLYKKNKSTDSHLKSLYNGHDTVLKSDKPRDVPNDSTNKTKYDSKIKSIGSVHKKGKKIK